MEKNPQNVLTDANGFPIDEKGNHLFFSDKEGRFYLLFGDGTKIIFHPQNKNEVKLAASNIAKQLAKEFQLNLEGIDTLTFSEQGHKHLAEMGVRYNGPGVKIPKVNRYFDQIVHFLNYLEHGFGFDFKYYTYIKFKEEISNSFNCIKTGLLKNNIPESHIDFAKIWIKERDRIFKQEKEIFNKNSSTVETATKTEIENPFPRIFKSLNGFKLFEYLKNNIVRDRYQLADYSFIFRHMQKDGYIYSISEKEFREFLSDNFEIHLDKLKPEGYCETDSKTSSYFTAKNLFKS